MENPHPAFGQFSSVTRELQLRQSPSALRVNFRCGDGGRAASTATALLALCALMELPHDLSHHAEKQLGIVFLQFEAQNQAARFFLENGVCPRLHISADTERLHESLSNFFQFSRRCWFYLLGGRLERRAPSQFVQTYRDCLAEVHGDVLPARRNIEQPVTVSEIFIREASFFRSKQQSNALSLQLLPNRRPGRLVEPVHRQF